LVGIYTFYKLVGGKHVDARVDRAAAKIDAQRPHAPMKSRPWSVNWASSSSARRRPTANGPSPCVTRRRKGGGRRWAIATRPRSVEGKPDCQAEALFQAVAEDKASRIARTRRPRRRFPHLGAIAACAIPRRRGCVRASVGIDPDDFDGPHVGWLPAHRSRNLDAAQTRLDRLLSLAGEGQSFYRFWAQFGLAISASSAGRPCRRAEIVRDGLAIAERLVAGPTPERGWQRDLSVSYNNIGDVLVAQGNLAEALKSFRDGLAIAECLAQSDAGKPDWQF